VSTAAKIDVPQPRVVVGRLQPVERQAKPKARREKARRDALPRIALMLALAYHVRRSIDACEIRDQAEAARWFGVTRARMTQILELTFLSQRIQEVVLCSKRVGEPGVTERRLRELLRNDSWELQEAIWRGMSAAAWGEHS